MRLSPKRKFLCSLILVVGILLMPGIVFAVDPLPWLDLRGSFDYTKCSGGSPDNRCKLTFSNWNITGGNYMDNSLFGEGDDPITTAYIEIGFLYNLASPNNLSFDGTQGTPVGTTYFRITDGSIVYLDATLDNFFVTDNMFGTQLNKYKTDDNITNATLWSGTTSQYINELRTTLEPFNLSWDFTFTSGPSDFTDTSSGSFQGKMYAGPPVPEPVSSILFVTGGATLLARRYFRKNKRTFKKTQIN